MKIKAIVYNSKLHRNDFDHGIGVEYAEENNLFDALVLVSKRRDVCVDISHYLFIDANLWHNFNIDSIFGLITENKGDVWHGYISENRFPELYTFYNPVWLYSLIGGNDVAHTNWKIGGDILLVKTDVLNHAQFLEEGYEHKINALFDWGYVLHNSGFIVRYIPALNNSEYNQVILFNNNDELLFAKRHMSKKWLYWTVFRHVTKTLNLLLLIHLFNKFKTVKEVTYSNFERRNIDTVVKSYKVSVFTPTLYRYSYLEEELRQLRNQTIIPHQIIITDQTNMEDIDIAFLDLYKDLSIHYKHQVEKGQCNAWNYCIENATGDFFLFLGDDADEIPANFIEQLLKTMHQLNADVVACNIKEGQGDFPYKQQNVFVTDTFPICLVRRSAFDKSGGYDYAYNKGIRADADVAIRMHLSGALMVLDPKIKIHHHRAPIGGLREYKQRKISNEEARQSIFKFRFPAFTEYYLLKRYFTPSARIEFLLLKYISSFQAHMGWGHTLVKIIYGFIISPFLIYSIAQAQKKANELFFRYPQIPVFKHENSQSN